MRLPHALLLLAYAALHAWRSEPLPPTFLRHAALAFNQDDRYGERDMRQVSFFLWGTL